MALTANIKMGRGCIRHDRKQMSGPGRAPNVYFLGGIVCFDTVNNDVVPASITVDLEPAGISTEQKFPANPKDTHSVLDLSASSPISSGDVEFDMSGIWFFKNVQGAPARGMPVWIVDDDTLTTDATDPAILANRMLMGIIVGQRDGFWLVDIDKKQ